MRRHVRVPRSRACCSVLPGSLLRAAEPAAVVINAVLSVTGGAAFTGQAQAKSLALVEDAVNRQGGLKGRPIHFAVSDDQGSPQITLQIVNRLADAGAQVIMGPSVAGTCSAVIPVVAQKGPVIYCMSPAIAPPAGGYVFSAGATLDAASLALVRFMRERGWTRLAAISSTDGSGQAFDHGVAFALAQPENKDIQMVLYEHMNPADISIAGQAARIKAANPQAVLTLATGTPWGTIMHGLSDVGLDVPIGGGHGNAIYDELEKLKAVLAARALFSGPGVGRPGDRRERTGPRRADALLQHVPTQRAQAGHPARRPVGIRGCSSSARCAPPAPTRPRSRSAITSWASAIGRASTEPTTSATVSSAASG